MLRDRVQNQTRSAARANNAQLESRADKVVRLLKLLADEQGLTVLYCLSESEKSVSELGGYADLTQAALSKHLAKLRAEGLVATRRDAQTIDYRLSDPATFKLIRVLCELYGGRQGLRTHISEMHCRV